ncbi:hypothetical protein HO173_005118 [Letharia columbiana]|uniref:Uncharacterized protein n=1 Tax=Letharia columbiana TaxID=112416 RepID=A0A8H6L609_9LECA|nr:uncharacterized protein HO173_005118 [Letharia columbiana]KAF6236827.1 hypothetical protein HO173_005118 [Letharia columbiana]
MTPNSLPGLSIKQVGSSAESRSSKRKIKTESAGVNTIAKRPKTDESATEEPANDSSASATVTDDLDTVISGVAERLSTMKLLLGRGNFPDVEELAKQGPGIY